MVTLIFWLFFGTGQMSEMNSQNKFWKENLNKRFRTWKWLTLLIDAIIIFWLFKAYH